jgi:hypothetical protein
MHSLLETWTKVKQLQDEFTAATHRQLGPCHLMDRAATWWFETNSTGSGGQTTSWMDEYHLLQSHLHEFQGPVELLSSEIACARASLRFGRQAYQDSPNSSSLEQGEGSTGRVLQRVFRRTPGFQENPRQGYKIALLATCKKWHWELLPTMWYLHTKLWFPNPKPGPDPPIQC